MSFHILSCVFDGIFLLFVFRIDEVDVSQFSIIVEHWILNSPSLLFLFFAAFDVPIQISSQNGVCPENVRTPSGKHVKRSSECARRAQHRPRDMWSRRTRGCGRLKNGRVLRGDGNPCFEDPSLDDRSILKSKASTRRCTTSFWSSVCCSTAPSQPPGSRCVEWCATTCATVCRSRQNRERRCRPLRRLSLTAPLPSRSTSVDMM